MSGLGENLVLGGALCAPLVAACAVAFVGWHRITAAATVLAAAVVASAGVTTAATVGAGTRFALGHFLRADALAAIMLIVIGTVATLAAIASISYLHDEAAHRDRAARQRQYGVLINLFVAAMSLAVLADNLGVVWVAIETTTVATAFLVGHRRTRRSLEATWKYVVICSVGIALALLGTMLLYFASLHAGHHSSALNLDALSARASRLDPGVTRLAAVLLLLGYGTKAGLAPFHTWLADAHSEAPAPVSALMSGVLLAVAMSVLLRVKAIVDVALGPAFLRAGLLSLGLLTLLVAALLLVGQHNYKRMLAYSSMEQMGLIAVAAAAGTPLALSAVLLLVLGHALGKSVLFVTAGHLDHAYKSTSIHDVHGLLTRSPLLGGIFAAGLLALLGVPPFALFASEVGIARGLTQAHLAWALVPTLLLMTVAFAAIIGHGVRMLFGDGDGAAIRFASPRAAPLIVGLVACAVLGVSAAPLVDVLHTAARSLGAA